MFFEGSQIGPYTLTRKLGRGGFGEVWLAERRAKFVTTKVAVKLPHDDQVDHGAIKQEATLWEQASGHPNILPIIDADEYDGQIVIVSEYAPDGSLDEWLKTHGRMPVEKAIETTIKILDGLEFLHSRNIIHRDLKPANILLQGETPRLADFGISRALRITASSHSSNVSGTFAYMSPEGFDGKRSVQTDVWSVGVNLYQLLTGNLPFPQKEPSALIAAIMMHEFEPLGTDVPQNLRNVIAKALAKQPKDRYSVAGDMRDDLRRVLRGEAVSDSIQSDSPESFGAEQIPSTPKIAPLSDQTPQDENETVVRSAPNSGQNDRRKSSNVWIYATLGIVLAGAVGLGLYFVTNQSKLPDSDKNEMSQLTEKQSGNNLAKSENINAPIISNANVLTPPPVTTPDKNQLQKVINRYIAGVAKVTGFFEDDKKSRKIVYGDIDDDGDEDAVVFFALFPKGGNGDDDYIAVFRNNEGQFVDVTYTKVASRGIRYVELKRIKDGKILLDTFRYSDEDAQCCPSINGKTSYVLNGNKLVEK